MLIHKQSEGTKYIYLGLTYFFTQASKTFNGPNRICHPYECHCVSKENIQTKKTKQQQQNKKKANHSKK